jgi:tetratricopeptide (TPR) repeat protein
MQIYNGLRLVKGVLLGAFFLSFPLVAQAQRGGGEPPKNLKVLPADMDGRAVRNVMQAFSRALDVECSFCHASEKENARRLDFASDDKKMKDVARVMMKMTQAINQTHLPELGRDHVDQVTCETCHHGSPEPKTLGGELGKVLKKENVNAAVEKYKELRDSYYGRAVYDFGEESLVGFAGSLSKEQATAALRICELNLEYFPKSVPTYSQMARIYRDSGDNTSALKTLDKALAIEPENRFLQRQIERLKEGN